MSRSWGMIVFMATFYAFDQELFPSSVDRFEPTKA
jgi:hypothetical protein